MKWAMGDLTRSSLTGFNGHGKHDSNRDRWRGIVREAGCAEPPPLRIDPSESRYTDVRSRRRTIHGARLLA
jgi:hypothetical protein